MTIFFLSFALFLRVSAVCTFFLIIEFFLLQVLTLFLPCLSKTELTGGLARAGAARRR